MHPPLLLQCIVVAKGYLLEGENRCCQRKKLQKDRVVSS